MRKVVSSNEVAHLWANQSQSEAYNQNRNVYFEGDTIWSYGSHFPMARHVDGIVLFTTNTYGPTTGKHLGFTAYACNHIKTFNVPDVMAIGKTAHKTNFEHYRACYEDKIIKASRARKYGPSLLASAERIRLEANEYSAFFKIRVRLKPANVEQITVRANKQRKAEILAEKKHAKELEKRSRESIIKWRNGEANSAYAYGNWNAPTLIRLIEKGKTVQTSRGATFPSEHAKRALPLVHRCVKQGKQWQKNGRSIHLGNYVLDRIDSNGDVKAGCHFVKYAEVIHLENLLNSAPA